MSFTHKLSKRAFFNFSNKEYKANAQLCMKSQKQKYKKLIYSSPE